MKRTEWMFAGAMSAALLMGLGCQSAQAQTPKETQSAQATGGSGASQGSDPAKAAGESGEQKETFELTGPNAGDPTLRLALTIAPGGKTASGTASIQEAKGSSHVETEFTGDITTGNLSGIPGHETQVLVATGHVPLDPPAHSGHGPAVPENFKLQMLIYRDGMGGVGTYKYRPVNGDKWIDVPAAATKQVGAK